MLRASAFLFVAAVATDAAAHTCARYPLSPFQLADRADEIAVVEERGGTVGVDRVLKGTGRIWTALPEGERPGPARAAPPPPPPPRAKGRRTPRVIVLEEPGCRWDSLREDVRFRVMAFATSEGWSAHPAGSSTVSLGSGAEERALTEAITFWLGHPDHAARRRYLLDLARRDDPLGLRAALHFRAAPELLHGMTRAEAVELVAAIAAKDVGHDTSLRVWLLEVLARLHVPEALPAIVDAALSPHRAALDELLGPAEIAERLAGGEALADRLGRSRDARAWMEWAAGRSVATRGELLRAGFARMGIAGEVDPDDRATLARLLRDGPTRAVRVLALDLCEQAAGAPLFLDDPDGRRWLDPGIGSAFLDGQPYDDEAAGWTALAAKCAAAVPR